MVEFDISQFAMTRKLLSMSGLLPYLKPSQRFTRVFIMSTTLIIACSIQVLNFLWTQLRIATSVLHIAYLLTTITMSIIYHYILFNKKLILRYLAQIVNDWNNIRQTKQFDVLLDYAFLYRKCVFIFIVSYNMYVSLMFLSSLNPLLLDLTVPLNESRQRILIIPMNWYTGQERHFLKILILELVISLILGLCVISGFSLYILILQHICAMFHIIGCLLDNILDAKEKKLKAIDNEVIYKRIIHVIKIHKRTIQSVSIIQHTSLDPSISSY
ncbi:hypothetical protein HZH66_000108 [Vespula vulgaris]|uniref:Uncharacterized protein n=1 Tax=Vespula vulgaris TaxID=7454 RepID=A0A834NJ08_VESVU|nr:hypothetical protein HZH66_000108 [Vespula vulgaris]